MLTTDTIRGEGMRIFGLIMCVIGATITALGVIGYYDDDLGLGIAGFVFGTGCGAIGVMTFLTDFILRIFRRSASLMIRFRLCKLHLEIHGELGTPVDEKIGLREVMGESEPERWSD